MEKTTNYEMFKKTDKNRARGVNEAHVNVLMQSIRANNLLHLRPICVDADYTVLDGQHRLEAARRLGVPIYYERELELKDDDIILLNHQKTWALSDYLNYYVKSGRPEYVKLNDFLIKNNLSLKIGLTLLQGRARDVIFKFKHGDFKFNNEFYATELELCWEIVGYIRKMNGHSEYTKTGKFWNALLKLVRAPNFDEARWRLNMSRMIERFGPRTSTKEYLIMLEGVHNYRSTNKIHLQSDEVQE